MRTRAALATAAAAALLAVTNAHATQQSLAEQPTVITGVRPDDGFGFDLASGDLDGDGHTDLAVSSIRTDELATDAGAVYVFYGPLGYGTSSATGADATIVGTETSAFFGEALEIVDFDGDGMDDLVAGEPGPLPVAQEGTPRAGLVRVFYGGARLEGMIVSGDAPLTYVGEQPGDFAGISVARAGDFDQDGVQDLVIGAAARSGQSGAVYVVRGGRQTGQVPLAASYLRVLADQPGATLGFRVAGDGDVNGDGWTDLLVGGQLAFGAAQGGAWLIYGGESVRGTIPLTLNATTFAGGPGEIAGTAVALIDLDMDGFDDALIGAPGQPVAPQIGSVYVVYGGEDEEGPLLPLAMADARFVGESPGDATGVAIADLGTEGGRRVLGIGSSGWTPAHAGAAHALTLAGRLEGEVALPGDLVFTGASAGDGAGAAFAWLPGRYVVSAPGSDVAGLNAGAVYASW